MTVCIKIDELCSENDGVFVVQMMNFVYEMMILLQTDRWRGTNVLGWALMQARGRLRAEGFGQRQ